MDVSVAPGTPLIMARVSAPSWRNLARSGPLIITAKSAEEPVTARITKSEVCTARKAAAAAANDPELKTRTWVLLTEAAPGGWGLWGHAQTNEELVSAARAEIGRLRK